MKYDPKYPSYSPIQYHLHMVEKSGSCKIITTASEDEVRRTVNWWVKETGWVTGSGTFGLDYEFGDFYWPTFMTFHLSVHIQKTSKSTEVLFYCVYHAKFQVNWPTKSTWGFSQADNERAAKRFANAVCHELHKKGFKVKPKELIKDPKADPTKLVSRIRATTFTCRLFLGLALVLSPASFIGMLVATGFHDPLKGIYAAIAVFCLLYTFALVVDIFRIRAMGVKGISTVKLALLALANVCGFALVVLVK